MTDTIIYHLSEHKNLIYYTINWVVIFAFIYILFGHKHEEKDDK